MAKAIPLSELPVVDRHTDPADFSKENFSTGAVILIDKPLEWSSFHAVKFVRYRVPPKKVGHAGTLDPLATGLLVICTGKATKSIEQVQKMPKEYIARITFGSSTPSYDGALEPDETAPWQHITKEKIEQKLGEEFSGEIMQKPPIYSAIRIKGERLYKKARRGEKVEIVARPVQIYETELLDVNLPEITLRVKCGKGTYIRSIAHDLGISLNSRAYMSGLERTAIGSFHVEDAFTTDEFRDFMKTYET
ncbi:tRNA pseudouridine(55) synthase TruB [Rhodohalobacter halophilus]|uniref:tRNA pseudouridine(55) synthase TruB n=1 Tax=Rhodohalobacter halophilus TaxID=1812810 RepID=UPI0009FC504E|nr:tRNA pseudouridine(55) synthase TruB [Rhodohalobacter halophilus]